MSAKVLAVAERVVTDEEVERAGVATERLEGQGCAGGVVFAASDAIGLLADLVFHGGLFHAPEAELAPAGHRHFFDQGVFDRGFRLKFILDIVEHFVEALFEFALQDDRVGKEAVFDGVRGGVAFAFGRDGPAGSGSVGTGSLDLTFGSHFDFVIAWVVGILAQF